MHYGLLLVPLITAFTGWLVGWLLMRAVFYPEKLQNLSWLGFRGFSTTKQHELAGKLGKLVSGELFSTESIEKKLTDPANFEKLMPVIETQVDDFLRIKLPRQMPMIGMLIGERTINELKTVFISELKELFPVVMKNYMNGLQTEIDPARLIREKITAISSEKLGKIIREIAGKQARKFVLTGAVIGLLMGLLQVFILVLT